VLTAVAMRRPVRSNSSLVGNSSSNEWPTTASRCVRKIARNFRLQSTMMRSRVNALAIGASSKALR